MVAIKVKEGREKWIAFLCIYRRWEIPGEVKYSDKAGIARQVARLKVQVDNVNKFCSDHKKTHVVIEISTNWKK